MMVAWLFLLAACPDGMVSNSDTFGQCCWPGQGYSRSRSVCVGEPSCPKWLKAQGEQCVSDCPEGKVSTSKTGGACCWPGQVATKGRCSGAPACPTGFDAVGSDCLPACQTGMVRGPDTATRCCWPDQAWSRLQDRCVGSPTCPDGFELAEDSCRQVVAGGAPSSRPANREFAVQSPGGERTQTTAPSTSTSTAATIVELAPTLEVTPSPMASTPTQSNALAPQKAPNRTKLDVALGDLGPELQIKAPKPASRKPLKGHRE